MQILIQHEQSLHVTAVSSVSRPLIQDDIEATKANKYQSGVLRFSLYPFVYVYYDVHVIHYTLLLHKHILSDYTDTVITSKY